MKSPTRFTLATPPAPGAIGLIQLHGPRAEEIARRLTAAEPTSRSRLVSFDGIDEGLIARLSGGWIQLMPHGGVRVIQRLAERLEQLGAEPEEERGTDARTLYPEAVSEIEADMLAAIARAASPAAVDPLLDQPRRWAEAENAGDLDFSAIRRASDRLDRWVDPPSVVLVGRANVGKSTLSNLVVGRASSITADLPGTTRDHVSAAAELPTPIGPLAVRWFDTPGLRAGGDVIERRARSLTRRALSAADVLIAVRDPVSDWPDAADLPREPDLWLINKADLPDARASRSGDPDAAGHPPALFVSALRGEGLDPLAAAVARQLGLTRLDGPTPWAFSPALRQIVAREDMDRLRRYTAGNILPMR